MVLKYKKFIFLTIFFVLIILILSNYLIAFFIESKVSEIQNIDFEDRHLQEIQKSMGMTCVQLGNNSERYLDNDLSFIFEIGSSGGDWLAPISSNQVDKIAYFADKLFSCTLALNEKESEYAKLDTLHRIFSMLRIYTASYDGNKITAGNLKKGTYEGINEIYSVLKDISER